jgi:hypothetical protein
MHSNNLGIERDCVAGIPTFDKPVVPTEQFIQ